MSGPYDDILHLPHPTSAKHPRMPLADRAAQFSAFRALSGQEDAIGETERLTDRRIELSEEMKAELDLKQQLLASSAEAQPEISVTWFLPDVKKDGGSYITTTDRLKKVDDYERTIVLIDGTRIPLDDVLDIQSELFQNE